jgi:hypothetical protein
MDVVVGERGPMIMGDWWLGYLAVFLNSVQWLTRLKIRITGFDQVTESTLIFFLIKTTSF